MNKSVLIDPLDPAPTAWGWAFRRIGSAYVLVKLKDGSRFGGFFGRNGFSASFPEAHDLYLEEEWMLDAQGRLLKPIPGNRGAIVAAEAIETVEFRGSTILQGGSR